jgi:Dna[CI] antecedent, DciA
MRAKWGEHFQGIIASQSAQSLREGVLYVRVLQPSLHYELEQVSKNEIVQKLRTRFGSRIIRNIRFRLG